MTTTTRYNLSKIMKNAWYLKKVQPSISFSACLKKAWFNEKQALITAKIEGRNLAEEDAQAIKSTYHPELLTVPADYYGNSRTYYGD